MGLYLGSLDESYDFGVIGPGFLNQVPTLSQADLFWSVALAQTKEEESGSGEASFPPSLPPTGRGSHRDPPFARRRRTLVLKRKRKSKFAP